MTDNELLAAFENAKLSREEWTHRAHVRVGFLYVTRHGLNEGHEQMRRGIHAFLAAHNVVDKPNEGYHETTTRAFIQLIHRAARERGPCEDSSRFCQLSPELLDRRVLMCYYTRDRIMSPEAKRRFIEPDLADLDQVGLVYPEFGERRPDVEYVMRPGAYAIIEDSEERIAVVSTPRGVFLPGGGQEPGESATDALHREVIEECGLTIHVGAPIGVADEWVDDTAAQQQFCKRGTFYFAQVTGETDSREPDHKLRWLNRKRAIEQLFLESQRWAVSTGRP